MSPTLATAVTESGSSGPASSLSVASPRMREPGDLDRRVEQDQLFKFNLQRIKIPLAFLREAVDGKPQHALFVRVQVLDV